MCIRDRFLAACFLAGTANHFVIAFKGQPIVPADLLALSTAASVGSGYTFALDERLLEAAAVLALCPVSYTHLDVYKRQVLHGQPLVQHDDAPREPALDERERAEDAGRTGSYDDDVDILCAHGAPPSLPCTAPRPRGRALPAL